MCKSSTPAHVHCTASKGLHPSIGQVIRCTALWSCSTICCLPVLIHCAIAIISLTFDPDVRLIHTPDHRPGPRAAVQRLRELWAVWDAPPVDGGVSDGDPALVYRASAYTCYPWETRCGRHGPLPLGWERLGTHVGASHTSAIDMAIGHKPPGSAVYFSSVPGCA